MNDLTGPRWSEGRWVIPGHVCVADADYGRILLDQHSGRYYQLNPTAVLVVDGLLEGDTLAVIADRLTGQYDVLPERAGADVADLVVSLERAGALVRTDGPVKSRR